MIVDIVFFFFFKQKTAYEIYQCDWSSDVCSSDLLEVIALAFEKAEDIEKAKSNVARLKKRYNSNYDFLVTGIQPKDADKALPMLNHVMSFPTTIFIDKKGEVRKIRTGYSGPATGTDYEKFTKDINGFVESLLAEE